MSDLNDIMDSLNQLPRDTKDYRHGIPGPDHTLWKCKHGNWCTVKQRSILYASMSDGFWRDLRPDECPIDILDLPSMEANSRLCQGFCGHWYEISRGNIELDMCWRCAYIRNL